MYPGEFEELFQKISHIFTLETVSETLDLKENYPKRNPNTPIWDTIDTLGDQDYIDLGNGKYANCKKFFKKTTRILFFILIKEFESRLFRIHRWNGTSTSQLDDKNLNDLIKELVDSSLIDLQREYSSRAEFKEDLKAISSFRNLIVHVNKKMEKQVDATTLIKRKKQIIFILSALQQILDKMEKKQID